MSLLPLLAVSWCLAGAADGSPRIGALERSVVRLTNTSQRADWRTPWNPGRPAMTTGSGFVVDGGRILTNAHVVKDSRNLLLYLHGDANPHPARIVALGHDCDLALVEPVERGVLDDLEALPLGEMPRMGQEVVTFGYPAGGLWLSSTRGTVSRVDVTASVHSGGATHLSVQTDAAINPGNSGGPVVSGDRVVGVAFQAVGSLENVGYFIPPPIVRHFLDDLADGSYDGFPRLDVLLANLDSPAARRRAGLADEETGVRVDFVHPASPAMGVLRAGDVLLSLDGEILANDGTFRVGDQRLQMQAVLDRFRVGDTVPTRVLREGERLDLEVPVARSVYPGRAYETQPRYVVYAGLVFVPLDREYTETMSGTGDKDILYEYVYRQLEVPDTVIPGRVVLYRRLDHAVNATVGMATHLVVERVNGTAIHSLEDLVAALETHTGPYHVFEFAHVDRVTVLDREAADQAHPEILEQYAVFQDRRL
ncbi:MAG: trypsin-like peptidase domain-containing protein [Deltaproteobacteria bacterium]|nr:trypsin-like peptidase domain-containing protein [Deltaproteobacteria bacterium]